MKVYFAIPSYNGIRNSEGIPNCPPFAKSFMETLKLFEQKGHEVVCGFKERCCYIQAARNELVKSFMETDCDTLFWLDDDISWKAEDALRLAEMEDMIVAGIYPMKSEKPQYPAVILSDACGFPVVRKDGCIAAAQVATGFLRIKRAAIQKMCNYYAERKYSIMLHGEEFTGYYDLFPQGLDNGRWVGEDYGFCRLWNQIPGSSIWVVPDIDFSHFAGEREFKGNYHRFLLTTPGGSEAIATPVDKALRIPGWMSLEELEWLADTANRYIKIVEIGSYLGRSTRAMADNTPGWVIAIDDWKGPRDVLLEDRSTLYEQFMQNMNGLIESGKVIALRQDHGQAPPERFVEAPDMVFIDGSHEYADVKRDISFWKPKVVAGGMICGHDVNFPGVKQAIDELLPEAKVAPKTSIWYCTL